MEKNGMSLQNKLFAAAITVLSVFSFWANAKPIQLGLIVGIILIGLVGLLSNKLIGGISGLIASGIGLYLKINHYQLPKMKPEKLAEFLPGFEEYIGMLSKNMILIIVLAVVVGTVCGLAAEKLRNREKKPMTANMIAFTGIFVALSVVINSLRVGDISFGGFPIIFAGYALGPVAGFIVGGVADIVGFLIRPSATGGFNPLFVLTSALTGAIPVLVTNLLKSKYPKYEFWKVLVGIFVGQMLTSVIMVPIFRVILFGGNTVWYFAGKAFIKQIFSIPVYALLITSVGDTLYKVIDFERVREKRA